MTAKGKEMEGEEPRGATESGEWGRGGVRGVVGTGQWEVGRGQWAVQWGVEIRETGTKEELRQSFVFLSFVLLSFVCFPILILLGLRFCHQ